MTGRKAAGLAGSGQSAGRGSCGRRGSQSGGRCLQAHVVRLYQETDRRLSAQIQRRIRDRFDVQVAQSTSTKMVARSLQRHRCRSSQRAHRRLGLTSNRAFGRTQSAHVLHWKSDHVCSESQPLVLTGLEFRPSKKPQPKVSEIERKVRGYAIRWLQRKVLLKYVQVQRLRHLKEVKRKTMDRETRRGLGEQEIEKKLKEIRNARLQIDKLKRLSKNDALAAEVLSAQEEEVD
ncbi:hypothetical protein ACOMHN_005494 [Nucella lapillus]